jgi:CBS domain-containing protein
MITVDELMTPNPHTLSRDDSLHDAWDIMTTKRIRHIPIIDKDNHVLGLVTQRDVLAATKPSSKAETGGVDNSNIRVSDIMIEKVAVIHISDNLRQAALHMQSHKYGCLPVIDEDCLVGIITDSDFVSIAINLLEQVELLEEQADDVNMLEDVEMPAVMDS